VRDAKVVVHGVIGHPLVYSIVQRIGGRERSVRQLAPYFGVLKEQTVLDVGAGTSLWRKDMPPLKRYIWLDVARDRFGSHLQPGDTGLVSSASAIALADQSVDYAVCIAVAHHLSDEQFDTALAEIARVARKGLVFLDALWRPRSPLSRAMWSIDAGNFPKNADTLRAAVSGRFDVSREEIYRVLHTYWVCLARPRRTDLQGGSTSRAHP
jgi:SAM-dependent methyltransferase